MVAINENKKVYHVWGKSDAKSFGDIFDVQYINGGHYQKVWIGEQDGKSKKYVGNTILFQLSKNTYMYVGDNVIEFHTKTPVQHFSSIMQSNGPNPYAITKDDVYLFGYLYVVLPKKEFTKDQLQDPWKAYYQNKRTEQDNMSNYTIYYLKQGILKTKRF
jgi:hypothetical protein